MLLLLKVDLILFDQCLLNPNVDFFFLYTFQIGAYDQQIWEKSVEQREIKVIIQHLKRLFVVMHADVIYIVCSGV